MPFQIRKFLQRSGLSHAELSNRIGVSIQKVSGWAAGYRFPAYEDLVKLMDAGMTLDEAFGDGFEVSHSSLAHSQCGSPFDSHNRALYIACLEKLLQELKNQGEQ